jgi:transcriptional regulator with XRE-family HTH domain
MAGSFGEEIRRRREALKLTLRGAAAKLEVSPAYLSRLERDQETPTPERVEQIAVLLRAPPDALFALAQQVAPELSKYVATTPALPAFLRVARDKNLSTAQIEALTRKIARTKKDGG